MLAIVIPYYKITFFEETLASLAAQTNKNFNVYIGDDASPDDPEALIHKYNEQLNITYKRFPENLGGESLTKQWDRCIKMIGDEKWLMVLGDDDLLSTNVVEEFYKKIKDVESLHINVIKFASQKINGMGETISKEYLHPKIQDYDDVFFSRFFRGLRSSLSEHIFSRSIYEKKGFRNLRFGWFADDLAWLEFSEFRKIYTINGALVYFRISEMNISRPNYLEEEKKEIQYEFFNIIVKEYIRKFKKNHIKEILKKYEILIYNLNKENWLFWMIFLPLVIKYRGVIEGVKFSRRFLFQKYNRRL